MSCTVKPVCVCVFVFLSLTFQLSLLARVYTVVHVFNTGSQQSTKVLEQQPLHQTQNSEKDKESADNISLTH